MLHGMENGKHTGTFLRHAGKVVGWLGVMAAGLSVSAKDPQVLDARVLRWLPPTGPFDGSLRAFGEQAVDGRIGKGFRIGEGEGYALRDREEKPVGDWDRDQAFSISLWVKADERSGGQQTMVAKMYTKEGSRGWCFDMYPATGTIGMELMHRWPTNVVKVLTPEKAFTRGQWHQVVVTYDGSSKARGVKLYVDGKEQERIIDKDTLTETMKNSVDTLVGARSAGWYKGKNLVLDDVRVFNRVLDDIEIARLAALVPGRRVGRGATVRVSLAGPGTLSLAEVEVYVDGFNVAPTGQASQSGTHGPGVASRGNDGDTNGLFTGGSVTHTPLNKSDPWWKLDLAFPAAIDRVVVWNRWGDGAGLPRRLDNAKVEVLNGEGQVVWEGKVASPAPQKTVFDVGLIELESLRPR